MEDQLVTVETYQFLPQAQFAKLQLEGNGIRVFLADAEVVSMDWFYANAIGNIKLQVPRDQVEKAQYLLEEMRDKASMRLDEDDENDEEVEPYTECLGCGGEIPEDQTRCPSCGWSYAETGITATQPASDSSAENSEVEKIPQGFDLRRARVFILVFSLAVAGIIWLAAWLLRLANVH
jgi:hypothetical protein